MAKREQPPTPYVETPLVPTTDPAEKPVKVIIREMWAEGKSRSEIAKALGVSYQRVFSLTKGNTNGGGPASGTASRPKVILDSTVADGRFDGVARIEAIRTLFAEGQKVGPIAKALNTTYQIVFQATRSLREQAAAAESTETGDEAEVEDLDESDAEEADEEDDENETEG